MLVIILMSLNSCLPSPDTADADTNSGSETSDTSDIDMGLDNKDPNLHNPMVISHLSVQILLDFGQVLAPKQPRVVCQLLLVFDKKINLEN